MAEPEPEPEAASGLLPQLSALALQALSAARHSSSFWIRSHPSPPIYVRMGSAWTGAASTGVKKHLELWYLVPCRGIVSILYAQ
jgi:hypothetical protein